MLKDRIQKDYIEAFKRKDRSKIDPLGMLKAAIQYVEIEARVKGIEIGDEDILSVIQSEVKKRKEAIEMFRQAGKLDIVALEEQQIDALMVYLPQPLSEEEMETSIREIVHELDARDMKDFGKVMKLASQKLKGKADGNAVKRTVEKLLNLKE